MKKFLAVIMAMIMVFGFVAACAQEPEPPPPVEAETLPAEVDPPAQLRIALVAHSPESILDDGSFNAGAWDGIHNFIAQHGISADNVAFFQPVAGADDARIDLMESTIQDFGADVLVLPGFHFVNSLYVAQDLFPDTHFILLDAVPAPEGGGDQRVGPNVLSILYAEHESGFLAGYAAVMEGFRELGFMGGVPVPAVVRFGHGFILGAEHAAAELGLSAGEVNIRYQYLGTFAPDPGTTTLAGSWYADGTEVIFVAAGGSLFSVIPAAEAAGGLIIGVDVDQSGESSTIITSAMKELAISVADTLNAILDGSFQGGRVAMYDAPINGVGLPMGSSQFNNFTQAQYDAIFAQLAGGQISVTDSLEMSDVAALISLVNVIES